MSASVERRAFRVTGRVQGVGFRWWTRTRAQELGLSGFVRNEPDGSVFVEAEGTPTQLDQLQRWLGQGPPAATVTKVEVLGATAARLPNPFDIALESVGGGVGRANTRPSKSDGNHRG